LLGRGAGEGPTASAIVADLMDLARGIFISPFGVKASALRDPNWASADTVVSQFYIRLSVLDKPGVIADVSAILRDHSAAAPRVAGIFGRLRLLRAH